MPSLLVRTFSFWRESDFYGKKKEKKKSIGLIARCERWCRILQK
jgi:hypothetical protein